MKKTLLAGFLATTGVLQGCVHLRPVELPEKGASFEVRQASFEKFKVEVPRAPYHVLDWASEFQVQLQAQSKVVFVPKIRDYYRKAGAEEAELLAQKAEHRFWVGELCMLGALTTDVLYLREIYVTRYSPPSIFPYQLGVLAFAGLGLWLFHDATMNYVRPSADSFNKYLKGRLDLSIYPEKSGAGIRTALAF